jgi:hypothetical protein
MWAFPKDAEATGGGHLRINTRSPETPADLVSPHKDRFVYRISYVAGLVIWADGVERTEFNQFL